MANAIAADPTVDDDEVMPPVSGYRTLTHVRNVEVEEFRIDRESDAGALSSSSNNELYASQTPLILAARFKDDISGAKALLDNGADVNARDVRKETALHFTRSVEMVRLLIAHGAIVHALDKNNRTPLFRAVRCSRADVVDELIKAGADVHATDIFGLTAMFQVNISTDSVFGHEVLLTHGASVQAVSQLMDTPLHRAAMYGMLNTVCFLADHGAPIEAAAENQTPLYEAAHNGFDDVVKHLLDRGAAVYGDPAVPNLPLFAAAINGHVRVVAELLARGASFRFDASGLENIFVLENMPEDGQALAFMIENCVEIMPTTFVEAIITLNAWFVFTLRDLDTHAPDIDSYWMPIMQELEDLANFMKRDGMVSVHDSWTRYGVILLRLWKWVLEYADGKEAALGEDRHLPGRMSRQDLDALRRIQREVDEYQIIHSGDDDNDSEEAEAAVSHARFENLSESEKIAEMKAYTSDSLRRIDEVVEINATLQPGSDVWARLQNVAIGLEALHNLQVVHGELAPKNFRLENSIRDDSELGELLALDPTTVGEAVRWMAPETLQGASESCASDVYTFGMCIIEAASGQVPWGNVSCGVISVLLGLGRLPKRPEVMTGEQWQLVEFICAKDPAQRPAMSAVADKFELLVRQEQQKNLEAIMKLVLHV